MSTERLNAYNALPADHEAIEHYKPVFLARGGDRLVYEAAEHPAVVIKASTFTIKDVLLDNAKRELPLDAISSEMRESLEQEVAYKNNQMHQYTEYFGTKHMLPERRYLMQVPVSGELLQEVFKDDWKERLLPEGSSSIRDVWTVVAIQKKVPEISDPNHLSLDFGGFPEERPNKPGSVEYEKMDDVFSKGDSIQEKDLELFFAVQDDPDSHALADLVQACEQDPSLKEAVSDFVRTAIRFGKETGNVLALAGKDNVILYQKQDDWNYLLVDAVPLYNVPILAAAQEADQRSRNNLPLQKHDDAYMVRAKNFVRTMNGLAAALGLPERLPFNAA